MRQIEVKPLTLENFKKYGSFSNMENPNGVGGGIPGMTFYPDMEVLELGTAHMASFSITQVKKALGTTIIALEQHAHCGEASMSLDGEEIHILNVLPERTYANDCTMHVLKEEERIEIKL